MSDQNQNYGNGQDGGSSSGSNYYYQDYTADMQQYQAPQRQEGPGRPNGLQIASLILGILGIPGGCCCYGVVGLLMGVVGLILAIVGNRRNKGCGIGIAGMVCSIVAIVFGILSTIYYALVILGVYGYGPFADLIKKLDLGYSVF